MSGPKKAEVQAQLNIARNSQRRCANLLAGMEEAAIANVLREVESLLDQMAREAASLQREIEALTGNLERYAPEVASSAKKAADQARREWEEAKAAVEQARRKMAEAERLKSAGNRTFEQGEREYEQAAEAVRRAGSGYLYLEMEWAKQAQRLFDIAAAQLAQAAQARQEAERAAVTALQRARQARSAVADALQQAQTARAEASARQRAEEEARRIAEQQRRAALLAVEQARAALNRLNDIPHSKFFPGQGARIKEALEAAVQALNANRLQDALALAQPIPNQVMRLEAATRQAQQEYERRRAEAEAEIGALAAAIEGVDPKLVSEWANDPQALDRARRALQSAREAMAAERFSEAKQQAQAAHQALAQALRSAAENKSADEKRQIIGQAIMQTLEELGFDVSYEPGTRTEPMRISGQTPDVSGKGDFDIALPLEGEVHFEVNTPPGDRSCVAAVQELEKRLAERGILWKTTHWGHAEGATEAATGRQKVKETQQQKVKAKGKT